MSGDRKDEPEVIEHSREGAEEDLSSEARSLLQAIDRATETYREERKESEAVGRSAFAESVGMGVNALRGKLEVAGEDEQAGELRWDLESANFDEEIKRVRSAVERCAKHETGPSSAAAERGDEAENGGNAEQDAGGEGAE